MLADISNGILLLLSCMLLEPVSTFKHSLFSWLELGLLSSSKRQSPAGGPVGLTFYSSLIICCLQVSCRRTTPRRGALQHQACSSNQAPPKGWGRGDAHQEEYLAFFMMCFINSANSVLFLSFVFVYPHKSKESLWYLSPRLECLTSRFSLCLLSCPSAGSSGTTSKASS